MNNEDFIKQLEFNFKKGIELIKAKNKDYAKDDDPFKNFKMSEMVGVPISRAILVRITDKLSRIDNLLDKEETVKNEKIEDTIIDCMNYLNILLVYLNQ